MQWEYVIGAVWMSCVGYMVGHIHTVISQIRNTLDDVHDMVTDIHMIKTQDSKKIL